MWTYEEKEGLLEHITVVYKYKDGVQKGYRLLAHNEYAIRYVSDEGHTDDEGLYHHPGYSKQINGGLWMNINDYVAEKINEEMEVC